MTERPILMSAPMVLACLREENPKTQTRRIVKGVGGVDAILASEQHTDEFVAWMGGEPQHSIVCPYGIPGDRLWVRETLRRSEVGPWVYRADDEPVEMRQGDPRITEMVAWAHHKEGDVCVSIHMPRWASRITLRITDVRVERLNEISEADALAEGVTDTEFYDRAEHKTAGGAPWLPEILAYADLWEHINGPGSWAANPWVWAVSFERVT